MATTSNDRPAIAEVDRLIEARLAAYNERVHRRRHDAAAKIEAAKAAAAIAQAAVDAAEQEAAEIAVELERLIGPDAEAAAQAPAKPKSQTKPDATMKSGRSTDPATYGGLTERQARWVRRRQNEAKAAFKSYTRSLSRRTGEPSELDDLIHLAMSPSLNEGRVVTAMKAARARLSEGDEKQAAVLTAWGRV